MFKYQKATPANWVLHPTKKQTITVVICMIVGVFLMAFAASNGFTESPFRMKYIILLLLIIPALVTTSQVYRNYSTNQKNS